jgi:membrane protein involved in D-alanine export
VGNLLTMGLMGRWHGAAPNYLMHGLYHGALLAAASTYGRLQKGNPMLNDPGLPWRALSTLLTFHLAAFGLLILWPSLLGWRKSRFRADPGRILT